MPNRTKHLYVYITKLTLNESGPQDVKEAAYKTLVRPILEYGSSVWDHYTQGLYDE